MSLAELTVNRSGKFRASTMIPNATKCAAMRTKIYRYHVQIDGTSEHLTKEGFITDNANIQAYFINRFGEKAKPWDAISCERMAITAAQELMDQLMGLAVSVSRVCCTIHGSNGATITAVVKKVQDAERAS